MSLVNQLVESLGVSEEQASGGAGLLFNLAREKLADGEFSQLLSAVPEAGQLADEAPEAGGVGGMLGSVGGMFGGKAESLGQLGELASGFSELDLSQDMIGQFVPTVLSYVQEKGGDDVRALLEKVIAPGA